MSGSRSASCVLDSPIKGTTASAGESPQLPDITDPTAKGSGQPVDARALRGASPKLSAGCVDLRPLAFAHLDADAATFQRVDEGLQRLGRGPAIGQSLDVIEWNQVHMGAP